MCCNLGCESGVQCPAKSFRPFETTPEPPALPAISHTLDPDVSWSRLSLKADLMEATTAAHRDRNASLKHSSCRASAVVCQNLHAYERDRTSLPFHASTSVVDFAAQRSAIRAEGETWPLCLCLPSLFVGNRCNMCSDNQLTRWASDVTDVLTIKVYCQCTFLLHAPIFLAVHYCERQ